MDSSWSLSRGAVIHLGRWSPTSRRAYDHITSAIGRGDERMVRTAMLCLRQPRRHIGLPDRDTT